MGIPLEHVPSVLGGTMDCGRRPRTRGAAAGAGAAVTRRKDASSCTAGASHTAVTPPVERHHTRRPKLFLNVSHESGGRSRMVSWR